MSCDDVRFRTQPTGVPHSMVERLPHRFPFGGARPRPRAGARPGAVLLAAALVALSGPAAAAPAAHRAAGQPAHPARLTATVTTQHEVTVTQSGTVPIPADATSVSVTLYGAATVAGPGATATGTARIAADTPIKPGGSVTAMLDQISTSLGGTALTPWLSAPAGGSPGSFPTDRNVFPDGNVVMGGGNGAPRAVLVFSVPAGDIGDLPTGVDFGSSPVPSTVNRNVPVSSSGAAPLTLTSMTASPPFAVENTQTSCPLNTPLQPGTKCSVNVTLTVGQRGPATGTLTFAGNFPGGTRSVPLTAAGVTIPGAPSAPTATAGDGEAVLSWMPPADNGGSDLTGFQIYRTGGTAQPTPMLITTVTPATLVYTDTGLTQGTSYAYVVRAVNAVGTSPESPAVTATPSAGLKIASGALPQGTAGQPYSMKIQALGGTEPYRFGADGLPPGILLDPLTGEMSGTPTDAGSTSVTITVNDSALPSAEAKVQLTLTVQSAAPAAPAGGGTGPQAARAPSPDGGSGGIGGAVWLWALLGAAGLAAAIVAVRRLRRKRA